MWRAIDVLSVRDQHAHPESTQIVRNHSADSAAPNHSGLFPMKLLADKPVPIPLAVDHVLMGLREVAKQPKNQSHGMLGGCVHVLQELRRPLQGNQLAVSPRGLGAVDGVPNGGWGRDSGPR